jgi:hypothetical protein
MNNNIAFIILAFYFGLAVAGTAQEFSYVFPQGPGQEIDYFDSYYPSYYPAAYWNYPYVPAKYEVQAAKERLWANKYLNPNSVWRQVQGTKERLWVVKNTCRTCLGGQEYGWMDRNSPWEDRLLIPVKKIS